MTLDQLPLLSWGRLGLGLLLFLGPGYLFLTLSPFRRELDRTFSLVAAFGLSVALWAILLSVTNLMKLSLPSWFVIGLFLLCWIIALLIRQPWQDRIKILDFNKDSLYRPSLWLLMLVTFILSLWLVRNQVAGSGSDSYHHTLFTQLIMDQGKLPEDYGPFTSVITFTYHYGFHAATAFLGWISGIPTRLLVLAVGKILVILCASAVALATEKMTESKLAGLSAAVVTATVCVFPSYMLMWGRYTQLTGLTLMVIFLALFWVWLQNGFKGQEIILLAILATGTGLTHYRVIAMTVVGAVVLAIAHALGRFNIMQWKILIKQGIVLATVTFIGLAPWFIHLFTSKLIGYPIISAPPEITYFSIQRLGAESLGYPTNNLLLITVGALILLGFFLRERIVIAMVFWTVILLIPSQKILIMDSVSVYISLFIPLAIVIGWGTFIFEKLPQKGLLTRWGSLYLPPIFLTILLFLGLKAMLLHKVTFDSYLRPLDLKAMEFIQEETPPDAYFMINIYRFPFSDILMVGSDAGYWIPLLANRRTVVPPMTFTAERVNDQNFADKLRLFETVGKQLSTREGLEMLKKEKVTHVMIGERGGVIDPNDLLSSPAFKLIYHDSSIYIFQLSN